MRYFSSEDIESVVGESLELTSEDIGTPSGHWRTQVIVKLDGATETTDGQSPQPESLLSTVEKMPPAIAADGVTVLFRS